MTRLILCCLIATLTGCASWYLKGAEMAPSAPPSAAATFTIQACATPQGVAIDGPNVTYYLDESMTALYEIDNASGDGARIINGWTDATGRYFFVWVGTGPGWQYFFPNDAAQPALRMNYNARSYEGDRSTPGVVRPIGTPSSTCVLQRQ